MIKGFMVYDNYYYLLNVVDEYKQQKLALAIFKYMFEDIEPNFDTDKQLKGIWINLKMPLDTSKKQSKNGSKGGRPKKPKKSQTETQKESQKKTNNISTFLFLFSNLYISNNKEYIYNLLEEYLELRKSKKYTLNETIVKRLVNKLNKYGTTDEEKIEIITNAINGAWKDFYPLKKEYVETKPDWFNKDIEVGQATEEEIKEMNDLLKEYK